jgi:hypothetical protein
MSADGLTPTLCEYDLVAADAGSALSLRKVRAASTAAGQALPNVEDWRVRLNEVSDGDTGQRNRDHRRRTEYLLEHPRTLAAPICRLKKNLTVL